MYLSDYAGNLNYITKNRLTGDVDKSGWNPDLQTLGSGNEIDLSKIETRTIYKDESIGIEEIINTDNQSINLNYQKQ